MTEKYPRARMLKRLAEIDASLWSLKQSIEDDLTPEDIAAGAEPLSVEQIQGMLQEVRDIVGEIAMADLRAEPEEWWAATDKIY